MVDDPRPPLDGVRLKIDRANIHKETFERETLKFFEHEPCRAVLQHDEQGVWSGPLTVTPPIPEHWSCIISDCNRL